jgi:hypothetical protein
MSEIKTAPDVSLRLQKVFALFDASGVVLSRNEICWLQELAKKADCPIEYGVPWVAGSPIMFGGAVFYPFTFLSGHWAAYWGNQFTKTPEVGGWLYGFASSKSKPGDKSLILLNDFEVISKAIKDWTDKLPIQPEQMLAIYDQLKIANGDKEALSVPGAKEPQPQTLNMKLQAVSLCKIFAGTTPEYWLTGISKAEIDEITDALGMIENSGVADPLVDIDSPKNLAIHNFKTAVKWCRKFHGLNEFKKDA